jgi:hypothetical protein
MSGFRLPNMPKRFRKQRAENVAFVNCTNHDVSLLNEDGDIITISPSGTVARMEVKDSNSQADYEVIGGFMVKKLIHTSVTIDLPEQKPGVFLIVSYFVKDRNRSRTDLVCPAGRIINRDGTVPYATHLVR